MPHSTLPKNRSHTKEDCSGTAEQNSCSQPSTDRLASYVVLGGMWWMEMFAPVTKEQLASLRRSSPDRSDEPSED
ncbi:hypothetical protein MF271_19225 (plasmid) [Deinococcus sp. KNUC1210]|uniref:hypothetical protein n=1 Tax=Deinococcus sp. KNUC1210 TaxID=2917691 RepID=UPI001EEFF022|nr:hypothetical protein [Deinococcus sp. KNUC1210]ULH17452.1 hypothetical protein MF271_19225 [Deinococcus sp. KNUC1210]